MRRLLAVLLLLGSPPWYRFFPDVEGRISMQAVGFDATLALVQLGSVAAPLPQSYTCANSRDDTIETFSSPVEARTPYAVRTSARRRPPATEAARPELMRASRTSTTTRTMACAFSIST